MRIIGSHKIVAQPRYEGKVMEVQVAYLQSPPPGLRMTDADRQTGRLIPVAASTSGVSPRVSVSAVVSAAQAHRIAPAGPLQLSLHGIVLSPGDNVADLLEELPARARSRVVFLLTPAPHEDCVPSPGRVALVEARVSSPRAADGAVHAMPGHCVFRESWLNTQRCARCHCTRTQHSLFAPTPQQHVDRAMTRSAGRHISPLAHVYSNASVGDGKPLPHYADPKQWEPRRGAQYHATSEVCKDFVELWGNADVCARCRRVRSAHEIQAPPRREWEKPRRSLSRKRSPAGSSPKRAQIACDRFIPVWDNNDYCATCYMQRVKHSQKAQRSPHSRAAPHQKPNALPSAQIDWLAALPQVSESVRRATSASRKAAALSLPVDTNVSLSAVNAVGVTRVPPSSGHSSAIPTPQKALNFSIVATLPKTDAGAATPTHLLRRNCSASPPSRFPWDTVMRFATMEVLLVCRAVCSDLRAAAVPLLRLNCRFIADTMDIPPGTRGPLLRRARPCAAVMSSAMRRRVGKHSDPLLRCCARHLLRALHELAVARMRSRSRWNAVKEKRRGLVPYYSYSSSSSDIAVAAAADRLFGAASGVEGVVCFSRDEDNTIDGIVAKIQMATRCDVNTISDKALRCIAAAFDEVHIAAAASVALNVERCEQLSSDKVASPLYFVSLTEFFDHYGLLPLVDYLNALEAVAQMKMKARCWLERVHDF